MEVSLFDVLKQKPKYYYSKSSFYSAYNSYSKSTLKPGGSNYII